MTEFGPEIRVDGVRPAWLRQNDFVKIKTGSGWVVDHRGIDDKTSAAIENWAWNHADRQACIRHIRLPADHFAYTVFAYNAKHGTDLYPWAGGDRAPEDWDGKSFLYRDGIAVEDYPVGWRLDWTHGGDGMYNLDPTCEIIGYTRRTETENMGNMPLDDASEPTDTRLTIGQALQLVRRHNGDHIAMLRELGHIRDDETEARIADETGVKLADVSRVIAAYEGMVK